MIDRQPGGTAEGRLSRSSGRRARGNRAGLPGRRGRRVRACLASSARYFRDCRAVLLEVDEADEGATRIREDDGRDRAYAFLDSFRVVLDDAVASGAVPVISEEALGIEACFARDLHHFSRFGDVATFGEEGAVEPEVQAVERLGALERRALGGLEPGQAPVRIVLGVRPRIEGDPVGFGHLTAA